MRTIPLSGKGKPYSWNVDTYLNFAVFVYYIAQIQNQDEERLIFIFYSLPLTDIKVSCGLYKKMIYLILNVELPIYKLWTGWKNL